MTPHRRGPVVLRKPQAVRDLAQAAAYISIANPAAARRFLQAAEDTFERLANMPGMGVRHPVSTKRKLELRKWSITGFEKYLVFYRALVDESGIDVYRVLHGARDLEPLLEQIED